MCVSDAAKSAARARWHGQGLQQSMSVQFPLLIGFALLPYTIGKIGQPCRRPRIVSDDTVLMPVSVRIVDMPEAEKFPILREIGLPFLAQRHGDVLHRRSRIDGGIPTVKPQRKPDKASAPNGNDQHYDQYHERRYLGDFSPALSPSAFHMTFSPYHGKISRLCVRFFESFFFTSSLPQPALQLPRRGPRSSFRDPRRGRRSRTA